MSDQYNSRLWALILAAMALGAMALILHGCQTYRDRGDGTLEPNKPTMEEMREICPL